MEPLGMAGLQAGSKIVDSLINIGEKSLDEALWGDYYRDKEVEQSQRLLDQQTEAQSNLMKQSKEQQLGMERGVKMASCDIRTDRWEVAREAKDKVTAAVSEKYHILKLFFCRLNISRFNTIIFHF